MEQGLHFPIPVSASLPSGDADLILNACTKDAGDSSARLKKSMTGVCSCTGTRTCLVCELHHGRGFIEKSCTPKTVDFATERIFSPLTQQSLQWELDGHRNIGFCLDCSLCVLPAALSGHSCIRAQVSKTAAFLQCQTSTHDADVMLCILIFSANNMPHPRTLPLSLYAWSYPLLSSSLAASLPLVCTLSLWHLFTWLRSHENLPLRISQSRHAPIFQEDGFSDRAPCRQGELVHAGDGHHRWRAVHVQLDAG